MMSPPELDVFYSHPSIAEWAAVLGPGMHYHVGYFLDPEGVLFDETLEAAQQRVVRYFYPWISEGARVLDIGCGWGGPAQLLIEEKQAEVLGVTISRAQAAYCREQGLTVEVLNAEHDPLPDSYEIGVLLEVLDHIQDKRGLFERLRSKVDRLLLTTDCLLDYADNENRVGFGGSVVLTTVSELRADLEVAGWRIESERERRYYSVPTYRHWKQNLDQVYGPTRPPGQLGVLRDLVDAEPYESGLYPYEVYPLVDMVAM